MPSVAAALVAGSLAFVGATADDVAGLSAQLSLTEPGRRRRVRRAHASGVVVLVAVAVTLGETLRAVPLAWFALLALFPLAFAARAWSTRHRETSARPRGALATAFVTLSTGGDAVAVWTPLVRGSDAAHLAAVLAAFVAWDLVLLGVTDALARHERPRRWVAAATARGRAALYVALAVLVLVECHVL
ncbi:MAG TPA: hypothetical protein PLS29_08845 [Acidimicrobiales bacterium]|nr:hypothetical protein [Acidimicrobiales bacterium]